MGLLPQARGRRHALYLHLNVLASIRLYMSRPVQLVGHDLHNSKETEKERGETLVRRAENIEESLVCELRSRRLAFQREKKEKKEEKNIYTLQH